MPDILKKVLTGLDVDYELQGTFEPRDYCVQYRETDFDFACRLMEEEGIFYFFKHADGSHKMVVADYAAVAPRRAPATTLIYEEGSTGGGRARGPRHGLGEGAGDRAPASSPSGTTASSCRQAPGGRQARASTPCRSARSRTS